MPQFSDDLFLGNAPAYVGTNANSALQNPSPMSVGFGPMGRVYLYDTTPAVGTTAAILAAKTTTAATTYSGTQLAATSATAGITQTLRSDGTTVDQVDYPRAVSVTTGTLGTATLASVTISGTGANGKIGFTSNTSVFSGQYVVVSGAAGGTGSITGYSNPTTYILTAVTATTAILTTLTGGAVVTSATDGQTLTMTFTLGVVPAQVTVTGYDYYGQTMTEIIQTGGLVSTVTNGRKAFFQVYSIAFSTGVNAPVSVDTTNILGLPARMSDASYVLSNKFTGSLAFDSGTFLNGYYSNTTNYNTQSITNFTSATPGVITVAYAPESGTLIQLTGALGTLTGVSLNTTYWWTKINGTTGKLSTTQANYLAGTFVTTGGTTITSGMNLVPQFTSTSVTPDVRGTYAPGGTLNGLARLVLELGLTAIQVGPNATATGLLGITQA